MMNRVRRSLFDKLKLEYEREAARELLDQSGATKEAN
jgi:hypothetical protein